MTPGPGVTGADMALYWDWFAGLNLFWALLLGLATAGFLVRLTRWLLDH